MLWSMVSKAAERSDFFTPQP